ncbi:hypothetical protein U1872_22230, partial [Sphingomonas sp. RB3P16]|uniref:hypothetical protein n=1 Tax=Parasphingomonas frigoris TaxID=3096163 RepID=UPI002FC8F463
MTLALATAQSNRSDEHQRGYDRRHRVADTREQSGGQRGRHLLLYCASGLVWNGRYEVAIGGK